MAAILLNGTSSSGKTSIARAIQKMASVPFLYASVDAFTDMFDWDVIVGGELWQECDRAGVAIFHRALPALLSSRFPVVIDHVLEESQWHQECHDALKGYRVLSVGVHCPLELLREREKARGDRGIGLAERQYPRVHRHGVYDLEVDTSKSSPKECAQRILDAFAAGA
jgi:chloramphenicol 3-O phosphotransferase